MQMLRAHTRLRCLHESGAPELSMPAGRQVQALKKHGKELEDRWERVAREVPGKSHRQCSKRFKELRTSFKARKSAT